MQPDIATHRQTALERQDLSCTYLAHHEVESEIIIINYLLNIIIIIIITYLLNIY